MISCSICEKEIAILKHFSDVRVAGVKGICPECGQTTQQYECGSMDEDGSLDVRAFAQVPDGEGW